MKKQLQSARVIDLNEDGDFRVYAVEAEEEAADRMILEGAWVRPDHDEVPATLDVLLADAVPTTGTAEEILDAAASLWDTWEVEPQ